MRSGTGVAAFCLSSLIAVGAPLADIGPKPTIEMSVVFSGREAFDLAGTVLLQCSDRSCKDAAPLKKLGPQRFSCEGANCGGLAYGFARFGMLELTLPDGRKLRSNVFGKSAFEARYSVEISGTGVRVREK